MKLPKKLVLRALTVNLVQQNVEVEVRCECCGFLKGSIRLLKKRIKIWQKKTSVLTKVSFMTFFVFGAVIAAKFDEEILEFLLGVLISTLQP